MAVYFLKLGATGFGGPIALAGSMQQTLVEERRWISPDEYIEGLALAQLAPGPLAAQLAMYLGYVRGGFIGATLSGFAFILPSFLMSGCSPPRTSGTAASGGCTLSSTASAPR